MSDASLRSGSGPAPAEGDRRLVTIARFLDPMRAQMAKGLLTANGIDCFLQGESANQLLSMAFRARLRVLRADEAVARELLRGTGDEEGGPGPGGDGPDDEDDDRDGGDGDAPIGILPEVENEPLNDELDEPATPTPTPTRTGR